MAPPSTSGERANLRVRVLALRGLNPSEKEVYLRLSTKRTKAKTKERKADDDGSIDFSSEDPHQMLVGVKKGKSFIFCEFVIRCVNDLVDWF